MVKFGFCAMNWSCHRQNWHSCWTLTNGRFFAGRTPRAIRTPPPPSAEQTLRLLNLERAIGNPRMSEALELIADLENQLDMLGEFSYSDDHKWHENLAA